MATAGIPNLARVRARNSSISRRAIRHRSRPFVAHQPATAAQKPDPTVAASRPTQLWVKDLGAPSRSRGTYHQCHSQSHSWIPIIRQLLHSSEAGTLHSDRQRPGSKCRASNHRRESLQQARAGSHAHKGRTPLQLDILASDQHDQIDSDDLGSLAHARVIVIGALRGLEVTPHRCAMCGHRDIPQASRLLHPANTKEVRAPSHTPTALASHDDATFSQDSANRKGNNDTAVSKEQVIEMFRRGTECAGACLTRPNLSGVPRHRFHEHCCRTVPHTCGLHQRPPTPWRRRWPGTHKSWLGQIEPKELFDNTSDSYTTPSGS